MDPRTRALAVDFTLAGGGTAIGALGVGGDLRWTVAIAAFGFLVLVSMLSLAEQRPVLELVDANRPASLVVAFGVVLAVGLVLVLGRAVVVWPGATLLLGMGVGLGVYRFVFGVVRPVPEKRLAQAQDQSVESTFGKPP